MIFEDIEKAVTEYTVATGKVPAYIALTTVARESLGYFNGQGMQFYKDIMVIHSVEENLVCSYNPNDPSVRIKESTSNKYTRILDKEAIVTAWAAAIDSDPSPLPSGTPRLNHFLNALGLCELTPSETKHKAFYAKSKSSKEFKEEYTKAIHDSLVFGTGYLDTSIMKRINPRTMMHKFKPHEFHLEYNKAFEEMYSVPRRLSPTDERYCCNQIPRYVDHGIGLQYYICDKCKKEVT